MPRREATLEACRLRLRPYYDDLVRVHPGRAAVGGFQRRQGRKCACALGTAVFSGMLGVTLFGIFLTPVFYSVIQWFKRLGVRGRSRRPPHATSRRWPRMSRSQSHDRSGRTITAGAASPALGPPAPSPAVARKLAWTLGVMSAFGPFAIDMYLPGLPDDRQEPGATLGMVQITLAIFLLGLAVGQVLWGTLKRSRGTTPAAAVRLPVVQWLPMAVQIACYSLAARAVLSLAEGGAHYA